MTLQSLKNTAPYRFAVRAYYSSYYWALSARSSRRLRRLRIWQVVLGRYCHVCGVVTLQKCDPPWKDYVAHYASVFEDSEYPPKWARWHGLRETMKCQCCGSALRAQQIAEAVVNFANRRFNLRTMHLVELCDTSSFRQLQIAQINDCCQLHQFFSGLPGLFYSEYEGDRLGVRAEDHLNLSYADHSFDLVLSSETLEHVPDFERALAEARRILKSDGSYIFTIPMNWDRNTRKRAFIQDNQIVHLLPPVYHGGSIDPPGTLAFNDFGADVTEMIEACGFEVQVLRDKWNRVLCTFVCSVKPS